MTIPVSLASKQLARALPELFTTDIHFAANGQEALEAIRAAAYDLLFLDLTMPELDGFETLRCLAKEDLMLDVIVVSGDIQPEAQHRVKELGARAFIKKPCNRESLLKVLPMQTSASTTAKASNQAADSR